MHPDPAERRRHATAKLFTDRAFHGGALAAVLDAAGPPMDTGATLYMLKIVLCGRGRNVVEPARAKLLRS